MVQCVYSPHKSEVVDLFFYEMKNTISKCVSFSILFVHLRITIMHINQPYFISRFEFFFSMVFLFSLNTLN